MLVSVAVAQVSPLNNSMKRTNGHIGRVALSEVNRTQRIFSYFRLVQVSAYMEKLTVMANNSATA